MFGCKVLVFNEVADKWKWRPSKQTSCTTIIYHKTSPNSKSEKKLSDSNKKMNCLEIYKKEEDWLGLGSLAR